MKVITVNKNKLVGALKTNRARHEDDYITALAGYKEIAIEKLEKHLANVRAGQTIDNYLGLLVPESHVEDYDRALSMLEWHTDETIEVSVDEFANYVQDDWDWKQRWTASNSGYITKALSMKVS